MIIDFKIFSVAAILLPLQYIKQSSAKIMYFVGFGILKKISFIAIRNSGVDMISERGGDQKKKTTAK